MDQEQQSFAVWRSLVCRFSAAEFLAGVALDLPDQAARMALSVTLAHVEALAKQRGEVPVLAVSTQMQLEFAAAARKSAWQRGAALRAARVALARLYGEDP